jgi:hypothetical protein
MATTPLTTLAGLKTYMGLSDTNASRDAALSALILQCSAQIENLCQRSFGLADYDEWYDGTGTNTLILRQFPVSSISSLKIGPLEVDQATDSVSIGYRFFGEEVLLNTSRFTRGRRNIHIEYSAGYSVIPPDLELVVNKVIANTYKGKEWLGYASKSLAGETVSFKDELDKPSQSQILQNYRRVIPL